MSFCRAALGNLTSLGPPGKPPSMFRHAHEWLVPALAASATLVLGVGCGGGSQRRPAEAASKANGRSIYVGEVGVLPAPLRTFGGPRLRLPANALTVPGRYPLDSIVRFNVPIRNDGRDPLLIKKIDPG